MSSSMSMSSRSKLSIDESPPLIDPLLIKSWSKTLGVVLYACELSESIQESCHHILTSLTIQLQCNAVVDSLVKQESFLYMTLLDIKCKSMLSSIEKYLETHITHQINYTTSLCDFYVKLAQSIEHHSTSLTTLEELTKDELFDCQETDRLTVLELEEKYTAACKYVQ
jgi:hypothetical protein